MIDYAIALADAIDDAWGSGSDITTRVVAGEFHAVSNCDSAWVWISEMHDRTQGFDGERCITITEVVLQYRLDICYSEDGTDGSYATHLAEATEVYGAMDDVWCHLVGLKDQGALLVDECDHVSLGPFSITQRSGGVVSAQGSVTVQHNCG